MNISHVAYIVVTVQCLVAKKSLRPYPEHVPDSKVHGANMGPI